jgi:hypothetical protein
MGREKERMLDAQFAPYRTDEDQFVCADCFSDPYIQEFIQKHEQQEVCSYCDPEKEEEECRAAPANLILEYIEQCVLKEYTDAQNISHSYDRRGMEPEDLVTDLDILSDLDGNFRQELEYLFADKLWLPENFYDENTTEEVFEKSWRQFKQLVKRTSRFVFPQMKRDTSAMDHWEEQIDPYSILQWIHGMVSDFGLISELPVGTGLFRVRADSEQYFTALDELGTSPARLAKYANRMSPAGIPMFYASDDCDTAIKEVWNGRMGVKLSVGRFETKQSCQIFDLCDLPPVPTIFKQDATLDRIAALSFLHRFRRDISQPVTKSEKEHVDYVPTQIMTEYFRHIYRTQKGSSIMGVKYPSAYTGKPCYVMFWGHREDEGANPEIIGNWSQDPTVQKLESIPDESCARSATKISYSFKTVQTDGEQARWHNDLETLLQTQSDTAEKFAAAIAASS